MLMRLTRLTLYVACAFAAAAAAAQSVKLKPEARPALTRQELRACLAREDALQSSKRAQESERQAIARENDALTAAAQQLAQDLPRTDTRDFSQVDGYNAGAAAHGSRTAALNDRITRFNAQVEQLNAEAARHLAQCAARAYDPADRDALLTEPKRLSPTARPLPAADGAVRQ